MPERVPAEAFPVGEIMREEMEARGWDVYDVAARMGDGDPATLALTVDLLLECSDMDGIAMSVDLAQRLGRAFDTSADFWLNLHRSFTAWRESHQQESE